MWEWMKIMKPEVEMKSSLNTGDQTVKFSASLVYHVRGEPADEC